MHARATSGNPAFCRGNVRGNTAFCRGNVRNPPFYRGNVSRNPSIAEVILAETLLLQGYLRRKICLV